MMSPAWPALRARGLFNHHHKDALAATFKSFSTKSGLLITSMPEALANLV